MFLWQVAIVSMAVDVYGLSNLFATNSPSHQSWSMFQSIMYNCFSKTLWSLALGWVIFSCHKGYGGVVNSFLSWKAWIPLSKLSYAAYLIHPHLQKIVFQGITSSIKFTNFFWVRIFSTDFLDQNYLIPFLVRVVYWFSLFHFWSFFCPLHLCRTSFCSY